MKKLLALVLVLGLTSLASADLILTVDGQPVTGPGEITLIAPSGTAELDLELTAGENIFSYDISYILSNAQAELITDDIEFPATFFYPSAVVWDEPQWVEISGQQWDAGSELQGPQVIMQGLILHCLDDTPVDLLVRVEGTTVVDGQVIPVGTVLGMLHIEQVPEPVTIALLGLGSLFLRRRS